MCTPLLCTLNPNDFLKNRNCFHRTKHWEVLNYFLFLLSEVVMLAGCRIWENLGNVMVRLQRERWRLLVRKRGTGLLGNRNPILLPLSSRQEGPESKFAPVSPRFHALFELCGLRLRENPCCTGFGLCFGRLGLLYLVGWGGSTVVLCWKSLVVLLAKLVVVFLLCNDLLVPVLYFLWLPWDY